MSQLARGVFGGRGVPYYLVQAATMLILVLAANTAYADFPRLASILARDRYLPRQFMNQGDRLAFSNGILGLSVFAALLLVVFGGDTHALIPLYMIGVFLSFTLSQAGMVDALAEASRARLANERRHQRRRRAGDRHRAARRGGDESARRRLDHHAADSDPGRSSSGSTKTHYDAVAAQLTLTDWQPEERHHNRVIVPDQRRPAGGRAGARLRADAVARCARGLHRRRSGGDRADSQGLGHSGAAACRSSCWPRRIDR